MSETIYLRECPFCGTVPFLFRHEYPNGEFDWLLCGWHECPVCSNIGSIEDEDKGAFMDAWNGRGA